MAKTCQTNRPNSIVIQAALGPDQSQGEVEFTCADMLSFLQPNEKHLKRCEREKCDLRKVKVPFRSLNSLLEGQSETVDFFSLDVEGMEIEVLRGFDLERFKPKLMTIEHQGDARDAMVAKYLAQRGYEAVAKKGCNVFYVPSALREFMESLLCEGEAFSG
jgi:FkbM family methyltransferase